MIKYVASKIIQETGSGVMAPPRGLCPAGSASRQMAHVYILEGIDGTKYIGSTVDFKTRLKQHIVGQVQSTKNRRPLKVIGTREFRTIEEAVLFEKKYKNSHGQLERDLKNGKIVQIPRGVA